MRVRIARQIARMVQSIMQTPEAKRPNTMVADHMLSENVVLCCGEDESEFIEAFERHGIALAEVKSTHSYRCYKFWKFDDLTLILTGIGTGCLEPLLYEILEPKIIKRIILIGTAAALSEKAKRAFGKPFYIDQAYAGGCAIRLPNGGPLERNWPLACDAEMLSTIVSTDFYYGFSQSADPRVGALHRALPDLKADVDAHLPVRDLVDMETGQFYLFCKSYGQSGLLYISIRGAANTLADFSEQTAYSREVLSNCGQKALALIFAATNGRLPSLKTAATVEGIGARQESQKAASDKLISEVRLFWVIQVAVGSALAFLAKEGPTGTGDKGPLIAGAVAFMIITIGAVYNLVGNYYTCAARTQLSGEGPQEEVVTRLLALVYLFAAAVLGFVMGTCTSNLLTRHGVISIGDKGLTPIWERAAHGIAGALIFGLLMWIICRWVLRGLVVLHNCKSSTISNRFNYSGYCQKLRRLFIVDQG